MSDPDKVAQNKPVPVPDPGGDTSGQYMFANLQELDGVIAQWNTEGDGIQGDTHNIVYGAVGSRLAIVDPITHEYMSTLDTVFAALVQHNDKMYEYNTGYAKKLAECREAMSGTERANFGKYEFYNI